MVTTLRHLFTPHHTNNHRPRLLHPMGMAVMMALVLVANSCVELLSARQPQGVVLGYASHISVYDVLEQTNQERIKNGLEPLILNQELTYAAQAKAADMFAKDYWAHISPDGNPPWTFIRNQGYRYTVAGENLARDFDVTAPMVDAWMASPTHRANIVHPRYQETGIAVVNGTLSDIKTTLVVQMFGSPVQPALAPLDSDIAQLESDPSLAEVVNEPQPNLLYESDQLIPVAEPTVLSQTETADTEYVLYVSPLDVKKSVALAVIFLIMAVLVIDEIIIRHKQTVRFVGRNLAHMSFLVLVLIIVWQIIQPGVIQ